MQSDRDLLKQALEWFTDCYRHSGLTAARWGMDALRERLAQPEQPMKAATTATEAIKLFPEVAYWYREFLEHNTVGGIEALKSSEDQLADPYNTEVRVAIAALREQLTQPEKSPLDRMAENARELGLDYEPVQEPVALEAGYETIIQWDEGGGKRSRRELARRIVALYTAPQPNTKVNSEAIPEQISEPVAIVETLSMGDGKPPFHYIECRHLPEGTKLYTQPQRCPNCASLEAQNSELNKQLARYEQHGVTCQTYRHTVEKSCAECNVQEDYTTPPRREWVGLTEGEMRELEKQFNAERVRTSDEEYLIIYPGDYWAWQRSIEAKLEAKNDY